MANNSKEHNLTPYFKMVVATVIAKKREIRCEKCGNYSSLEFHHLTYVNPTINDLQVLCSSCHRASPNDHSGMETVFRDGKRLCHVSGYEFEY